MKHLLYETGDADAPVQIRDRNGAVVLGLCRRCGAAEVELSNPCHWRVPARDVGSGYNCDCGVRNIGECVADTGCCAVLAGSS